MNEAKLNDDVLMEIKAKHKYARRFLKKRTAAEVDAVINSAPPGHPDFWDLGEGEKHWLAAYLREAKEEKAMDEFLHSDMFDYIQNLR